METHDLPSVPARAGDDGTESLADMPTESIDTNDIENLRDMPAEVSNTLHCKWIFNYSSQSYFFAEC